MNVRLKTFIICGNYCLHTFELRLKVIAYYSVYKMCFRKFMHLFPFLRRPESKSHARLRSSHIMATTIIAILLHKAKNYNSLSHLLNVYYRKKILILKFSKPYQIKLIKY